MKKVLREMILNSKLALALALAFCGFCASAANHSVATTAELTSAISSASAGDTITLAKGTYEVAAPNDGSSAAFVIDKAITIVGATGNPADVIVRNTAVTTITKTTGANSYNAYRVFLLNHANAVVSGITAEGGRIGGGGDFRGGNVLISSNGGTVTNCILRNAIMYGLGVGSYPKTGAGGVGIACASANGLITHCVITNNFATRAGTSIGWGQLGGAAGAVLTAGVIRDSLIAYNTVANDNMASAVLLNTGNSKMENCTIANNSVEGSTGTIYPVLVFPNGTAANNPYVRNTLIYGNTGVSGDKKLFADAWVSNYSSAKATAFARFESCATDGTLPSGLSMTSVSASDVTSTFQPTSGSALIDAGATQTSPVALDLAGNPRINGSAVDIGCYEFGPLTPSGGDDRSLIQARIDAAAPTHGTVELGSGKFLIGDQLMLTNGVTLVGQGYDKTIIKQTVSSASATGRCITLDGGAKLQRVTLTGGKCNAGGNTGAGAGALVKNGTISWCCITNNASSGSSSSGGGVSFSSGQGSIDHSIVAGNTITSSSWGAGIGGLNLQNPITIDACLIYDNADAGGSGGGIAFDLATKNVTIRNTTVTRNSGTINSGGVYFTAKTGSGAKIILVNDIIAANRVQSNEKNVSLGAVDTTNSKNCLIFGSDSTDVYWKNQIGGSLSSAPQFVNAANNDFHLAAVSPARAAGVTTDIGVDLDGVSFASTPSIGCYEVNATQLPLGWTAVVMDSRVENICTDGTLQYAYTASSSALTINGVSFAVWGSSPSNADATISRSGGSFTRLSNGGDEGVSGDFGTLLNCAYYENVKATYTVTLNNLQSGKRYLVQLFAHYNNGNPILTVDGTNPAVSIMPHASSGTELWTYGGSLIGVFAATGTSQSFTVTYSGDSPAIFNAIQVRELSSGPTPVAWDDEHGTFAKRIAFTADGYTGSSTLENFPVAVRLSESTITDFDYDECGANGANIIFSDADGNLLRHEIDTWDTTGTSIVWVNVASLSQGATFYMYFDGTPSVSYTPTATWNSDYVGVWHMTETSGNVADATAHGLNAVAYGSVQTAYTAADTPIGVARTTGATADGQFLVPTYDAYSVGGDFTMSGWVRMSAQNGCSRIFSRKAAYSDQNGWEIETQSASYTALNARGAKNESLGITLSSTLANAWSHLAFVYNGTNLKVYQNGVLLSEVTVTSATDNNLALGIGGTATQSDKRLRGSFDECRLLDTVASADWVKAEYQQGVSSAAFLSNAGVETRPQPTSYAVSWSGGANATTVATVDGTAIASGDLVANEKSVVFTVTPASGYEFATTPSGWTKSGSNLTCTETVNGAAIAKTIPDATVVTYAVSWSGGANATTVATVDGTAIASGAQVANGKSVVFTVTPASGYEFATTPSGWTKSGSNLTCTDTVSGAAIVKTIPDATAVPSMFYVNSVGYATWEAAYAAVSAGGTITVGENASISLSSGTILGKAVTIDLNGNTLTWNDGGWVNTSFTFVDSSSGHAGVLSLPSGDRNVSGSTLDLTQLTGSQLQGSGKFHAADASTVVKFPSDMVLTDCTSFIVNQSVNASIVVQGITYIWNGSAWVRPTSDPAITTLIATPNGATVRFSLAGITLGTDAEGVAATSCDVTYSVSFAGTQIKSGTARTGLTSPSFSFDVTDFTDGNYTCTVTITTDKGKTATKSVAFTVDTTPAYVLGWTAAALTTDPASVRTDGSALYAYACRDDKTVNGVTFTGLGSSATAINNDNVSWTLSGVKGDGTITSTEVSDTGYRKLLNQAWNLHNNNCTVTLKNLIPGNVYLVQFIGCFINSDFDASVYALESADPTIYMRSYSTDGWPYGGTLVGVFAATETTKEITLSYVNQSSDWICFNAVQVRDVSPIETVTPQGSAAANTSAIQAAIDRAAPVHRQVNLSGDLFEINAQLFVTNGVTLQGQGYENTILKQTTSTANSRIATIDGGATIRGVTMTGGYVTGSWNQAAGAMVKNGTISWCCITNNTAVGYNCYGAGVSFRDGKGQIDHSIVAGNLLKSSLKGQSSMFGGGIGTYNSTGPIMIDTCLVVSNVVMGKDDTELYGKGGGIYVYCGSYTATVRNTTVSGNSAKEVGGGLYLDGNSLSNFTMLNTVLSGNTVAGVADNFSYRSGKTFSSSVAVSNCLFGLASEVDSSFVNSFAGDPGFVNAAKGDYHLGDVSPAVATGVNYQEINVDLDRVAFAAPPSIGCYEYVGSGIEPENTPAETRKTIQDAIDAVAPAHGTVHLGEGVFEINAELFVTNGVTLVGQGYKKTIVKQVTTGGDTYRVATVNGGATLKGITVTGGYGDKNGSVGAGVMIESSGTVSWCCITNNINNRYRGGGIFVKGNGTGDVTIDHTIVSHNKAAANYDLNGLGGGIFVKCENASDVLNLLIDTCLISDNDSGHSGVAAPGGGIAIADRGTLTVVIRNSTIANNQAIGTGVGGGIYTEVSNVTLINNIFTDNTAGGTAVAGDANIAFLSAAVKNSIAAKTANCFFGNDTPTFGANPISGVVDFVGAADGNYHLSVNSPALGSGVAYDGLGVDLDNVDFVATPSVGCYEYASSVPVPRFDPESGTRFYPDLSVRMSVGAGAQTIRYTVDGTVPTSSSAQYTSPITIEETTTFKARAFDTAGNAGAVVAATYTYRDPDSYDYFVSLQGNDNNDGRTELTAFRTIQHAVDVAVDGERVYILPGTFQISSTITITNAITVAGAGWDNTIIKASAKGYRIVELDGGAKLEHVTLTGAYLNTTDGDAGSGAGAKVTDGTLSWCCITNNESIANSNQPVGGGVSFKGGRGQIDHCIVAKNKTSTNSYGCGIGANSGSGSSISGPVLIDTCLVYGNVISYGSGGGIAFRNANYDVTIRNCTIIGNSATSNAGGLRLENGSGTVTVINTILAGNLKGSGEANLSSNRSGKDVFSNCLFGLSGEIVSGMTNCISGDPGFVEAGNYHISAGSLAAGAGVTYADIGETLDGVSFNDPPSIGCYEPVGGFLKPTFSYLIKHGCIASISIASFKEGGTNATVTLEYGLSPASYCAPQVIGTDVITGQVVQAVMTDLQAYTSYSYRFTATDNKGQVFTSTGVTVTPDWDVLAFGIPKTTVSSVGATASVTIMKLGAEATRAEVWFQWGSDYNSLSTPVRLTTVGVEKQTFSYPISGLANETTYVFRFTGTNDVADAAVAQGSFTTLPKEHLVISEPKVSDVNQTSAKVSVKVKTVGEGATRASVAVRWGTVEGALDQFEVINANAQEGDTVTKSFAGLTANTLYYYTITATNDAAEVENVSASGAFMTDDPGVTEEKKSESYVTPVSGEAVTYHADTAGDPTSYDTGSPYWTVTASEYPYSYPSTAGSGQTFAFRNEWDFRYNASARITRNGTTTYYLFLSDAVDASQAGDTIELLRNNYAIGETMTIANQLTILGNGYAVKVADPFLDKQGFVNATCTATPKNVFKLTSGADVYLENMMIMGGGEQLASGATGVNNDTTPAVAAMDGAVLEMDHVTVKRSQGAVYIAKTAKVHLNACNLVRNARYCGGGFYSQGFLLMENSSLSENRSLNGAGGGAGAENQGMLVMNNCVICNNGSTEYGGAINQLNNTGSSGIVYMMNMTMAGNFSSHSSDYGGGIGIHQGSGDMYMVNCILCNNYKYADGTGTITVSDIRSDAGNNHFIYSVYGTCSGSVASSFENCWVVSAAEQRVFKDYTNAQRTFQQANTTKIGIPGPALENDPASPDARYAPLTEDGSAADVGTLGVYTYFDASDWRSSSGNTDISHIEMGYKAQGGSIVKLGSALMPQESDLVTTYYESAFAEDVTDRELGVVGASGFGTFKKNFTLYLLKKAVNGALSDNLTIDGVSYAEGTEVTVLATPAERCSFLGWYDENDELKSEKTAYTFTMDSHKYLYAKFSAPSKVHEFLNILCEQTEGTHDTFPITITADWLKKNYPDLCPDGIPTDHDKIVAVEARLNAKDNVNGLNHVWMNYVIGQMNPGDPDGRIWIKADQTTDKTTLKFSMKEFIETEGCGFRVRYRLAPKDIANEAESYDRTRAYWEKKTGVFSDEDVTKDDLKLRVIDMIFIPTGHVASCEYVTTVNTAGVMKVDSTKKFEILAAPWVGFSPTNSPKISAQNYVKSGCLDNGDVLYVYDYTNNCYNAWKSSGGGWDPLSTYQIENGTVKELSGQTPDTGVVPRGAGTWLERQNPTKTPIYLYGQYDPRPVSTVIQPGFNLIAPPVVTNYNISKLQAPVNQGMDGDHIIIPTDRTPKNCYYTTNDTINGWAWKTNMVVQKLNKKGKPIIDPITGKPATLVQPTWTTDGMTLEPGYGFWYYNRSTADMTLWWADPGNIIVHVLPLPEFPDGEPAPAAGSVGRVYMTAEPPFVAVMTKSAPRDRLHLYYTDEDGKKLDGWEELGLYEWNNRKINDWRQSEEK